MHSVLVSEHVRNAANLDETIHQRLSILQHSTTRVENNGLQLALIANQNDTLCSVDDGNHRFGLHRLRGFINNHGIEGVVSEESIARRVASTHDNTGLIDNLALHIVNGTKVTLPFFVANLLSVLDENKNRDDTLRRLRTSRMS